MDLLDLQSSQAVFQFFCIIDRLEKLLRSFSVDGEDVVLSLTIEMKTLIYTSEIVDLSVNLSVKASWEEDVEVKHTFRYIVIVTLHFFLYQFNLDLYLLCRLLYKGSSKNIQDKVKTFH